MRNSECKYERICVIVQSGHGTKVMKIARSNGTMGGTIVLGKGTARGRFLDFLGLTDVRKEIVYIIAGRATARQVLHALDEEINFEKPNHGIAFTTAVKAVSGSHYCQDADKAEEEEDRIVYHLITTVVEKGNAELVVDAAAKAGATGGTIINGRGSSVNESSKLFNMEIEPEKEVVLIIVEAEKSEAVVASIREGAKIDEPGRGILFVQEVQCAYGLTR